MSSPTLTDRVSYYITQIEAKIARLDLSLDNPEYNAIFHTDDDKATLRALRVYNEQLNALIDERNE